MNAYHIYVDCEAKEYNYLVFANTKIEAIAIVESRYFAFEAYKELEAYPIDEDNCYFMSMNEYQER